jgi:hypothetical protein
VAAQRGGEVDRPGPAQRADGQVAQDRHDVWRGTGADLEVVDRNGLEGADLDAAVAARGDSMPPEPPLDEAYLADA